MSVSLVADVSVECTPGKAIVSFDVSGRVTRGRRRGATGTACAVSGTNVCGGRSVGDNGVRGVVFNGCVEFGVGVGVIGGAMPWFGTWPGTIPGAFIGVVGGRAGAVPYAGGTTNPAAESG